MTADLPAVTLTTDGASIGNPGPGGWAALLEYGTTERLLSGPGSTDETNNRMELQAVIEGLRALKKPCAVLLRADSQYVLNGIGQLLQGRALAAKAKNADLWQELAPLLAPHALTLEWVRGHAGDERNERVDQAASAAAQAVLLASPAYQAHQRQLATIIESLQMTERWALIVAAPPACAPARWRLYTPDAICDGQVRTRNPAIAGWRAFLAGVEAALERAEGREEPLSLDVVTNADVVVKQATGIWNVEHPALVPLFHMWETLRRRFGEAVLLHAADEQVLPLVSDPAAAPAAPPSAPSRAQPTPAPALAAPAARAEAPDGAAWTLVVRSGRPVRWRLTIGGQLQEGEVPVGEVTEPVAVWQACLAGLAAAAAHPGAAQAQIQVLTNYDLVVKQATGVWRAKNAEIQALVTMLRDVQKRLPGITFTWIKTEALAPLLAPAHP
ncbi:MAG TPA: RNase H family protein [Herpetosiphonaceae bacterium]